MTKVITYGTFDLLHHGHLRLLKRAKALGDYLIVGVTTDDFDKVRGKINVKQSLMERIEGVRATGLADEIIAEEYEGQKIDDIKRFNIDIFTVGSDWIGRFDYLEEFCKVVYLERTEGISSSEIRSQNRQIRLGLVGESERMIEKHKNECEYVNGICIAGICSDNDKLLQKIREIPTKSYDELLDVVDALYIVSNPKKHYEQIKKALLEKKHVLCDSPITLSIKEHKELNELAKKQDCILMDSLKTAYSTAYARLLLLVKSGKIGQVYSVDTTCTSLTQMNENSWNSICEWGPVALLPIFDIFGVDYKSKNIISHLDKNGNDEFTKISFIYKNAVASAKVGKGVKSEGELVISGTKGYIYVPAPWWKTDYFEIRYENASENKRYFYQLDGEGIRYELSAFVRSIEAKKNLDHVGKHISEAFCKIIEDFNNKVDFIEI
ncbi:adenylyltransferase/cytidyltransferase family protein [Campylobacter magnus]|uniref:adenylyltransferase/cytidyltransferase family protein n=1 Tax=Campylobacter magnus TaxID=3026462 RepID=UPI0030815A83